MDWIQVIAIGLLLLYQMPFDQVKGVYETMQEMFRPMGLKLDFAYVEKTRPVIAAMLK